MYFNVHIWLVLILIHTTCCFISQANKTAAYFNVEVIKYQVLVVVVVTVVL